MEVPIENPLPSVLENSGNIDGSEVWSDDAVDLPGAEENSFSSVDEEDDDSEPKLKYERLGNDLRKIFMKDSASCIAVNSRFLVLGSHWGMIHVLDHLGNAARGHELVRVVVHGLYSADNTHNLSKLNLDVFVSHEVRRLPEQAWYKWNRENFVAWATDAGVRVADLNERKTISLIKRDHDAKYRPELLRCHLCWQDGKTLLIGWADTVKICVIRRNREPPQAYRDAPQHLVEIVSMFTTDFFICGIAPLVDPGGGLSRGGDLGSHLVLMAMAKEEGVVVDPTGKVSQNSTCIPARGQKLMLTIIEPRVHDYTEIVTDLLSVRNYADYKINDYHMDCLIDEGLFFIVSPKDVIVAKPRDADDHIDWLLDRWETSFLSIFAKFEEALNAVENSGKRALSVSMSGGSTRSALLTRHTLLDVGQKYLDHLVASEKFEEAAKHMPKILGRHKTLWENEAYKFASASQLKALAPYLPKGEEFQLDPIIYEMVLYDFLRTDTQGFLGVLLEWPSHLYNMTAVINAVLDCLLAQPDQQVLLQALARLYSLSQQFRKALDIYLKSVGEDFGIMFPDNFLQHIFTLVLCAHLSQIQEEKEGLKHKDVFALIDKYELVDSIKDLVPGLMELDAERAVQLFLDHIDKLPPDVVVVKLNNHSVFSYKYLDALYKKDAKAMKRDYHGKLVELYSLHDREKLLPFLQSSSVYSLQDAFGICRKGNLFPEMVYLLTRMGNTRQALKLITENLEDVNKAIEYCKEHDDRDLWHDLIQHSLDKPKFIAQLLLNIGTHVDPLILIRKIKNGLEIPGMRDALVKILRDYNLQVSLQEGFQCILVSDCFSLQNRLVSMQNRAVAVRRDQVCHACQRRLVGRVSDASVLVFFCRHSFHAGCLGQLQGSARDVCSLCRNVDAKSPGFGLTAPQ
ncbi:unnamed protein product [Notodromas monacha]|uniref:RING-type domain-containing protein n=1 Tax=Notodromas monacha TaxID=399045 RepID=A0A7R9GIB2_9CRUS|nr:unnamed protein product [Notodromas monacha]CAG0922413.1 unnamed protein product [Notodromas monacha]